MLTDPAGHSPAKDKDHTVLTAHIVGNAHWPCRP